jgi:hypothetical protein
MCCQRHPQARSTLSAMWLALAAPRPACSCSWWGSFLFAHMLLPCPATLASVVAPAGGSAPGVPASTTVIATRPCCRTAVDGRSNDSAPVSHLAVSGSGQLNGVVGVASESCTRLSWCSHIDSGTLLQALSFCYFHTGRERISSSILRPNYKHSCPNTDLQKLAKAQQEQCTACLPVLARLVVASLTACIMGGGCVVRSPCAACCSG